jgi:flagellar assembly factor FliW
MMDNTNAPIQETRKINTNQFGELNIDVEHVFIFSDGLLGFEDLREFVLISEEETIPFKWLISLEKPDIGFPLLSPWHVDLTYNPGPQFDLDRHVLMVVITLEDEKGLMTANMKAPIVLDVVTRTGKQAILSSDKYSPSHVIVNN